MKKILVFVSMVLALNLITTSQVNATTGLINGTVIYVGSTSTGFRALIKKYDNSVHMVFVNVSSSLTQRTVDQCERYFLTSLPALNSKYTASNVSVGIMGTYTTTDTSVPVDGHNAQTLNTFSTVSSCEVY
ncbi:MAG: hypothetical protein K1X29_03515 [Bdellovibrionales bacterium]|nr:hypothetical protein [Bdellovibrionales bacterium]